MAGAVVELRFYAADDLLGAAVPLGGGAELRLPHANGERPAGCDADLPEDPIYGVPPWCVGLEDGWFVQGAYYQGPALLTGQIVAVQRALAAIGAGEVEFPATSALLQRAWTRAVGGDIPTLDYQLLGDARQALRTGFPARAVVEAAMAVEWAFAHRYREEESRNGRSPTDIARVLKGARGLLDKATLVAGLIKKASPSDTADGDFSGFTALRRARNGVAHDGQLGSGYDPTQLLSDARALVDLVSPAPWLA